MKKAPRARVPASFWTTLLALVAASLLALWPALGSTAEAAAAPPPPADMSAASRALQRAQAAVVGVQVTAVEGARSARTLGQDREGSGVVIGRDGLVLTIGYLILEAEQVEIVTDDDRTIPARAVGYDVATGFGLVQALAPLGIEPVPLGRADSLRPREGLMIASGGEDGAVQAPVLGLLGVPHPRRALHDAATAGPQRRRALQHRGRAGGHRLALRHRCRGR